MRKSHSEELRAIWSVAALAAGRAFDAHSPAYMELAAEARKAFEEYDLAVKREVLTWDAPLQYADTDPLQCVATDPMLSM